MADLLRVDGFDGGFVGVAVAESAVLVFSAVVIDGFYGIVEEFGDADAGFDIEADLGEDSDVGWTYFR